MEFFPNKLLEESNICFKNGAFDKANSLLAEYKKSDPYKEISLFRSSKEKKVFLSLLILNRSGKSPDLVADYFRLKMNDDIEVIVISSNKDEKYESSNIICVPSWLSESESFNAGAISASGQYTLFLYDDDLIEAQFHSDLRISLDKITQNSIRIRVLKPEDETVESILRNTAVPSILSRYDRVLVETNLFNRLGGFNSLLSFQKNEELAYRLYTSNEDTVFLSNTPIIRNSDYRNELEGEATAIALEREYLIMNDARIFEYSLEMQKLLSLHALSFIENQSITLGKKYEYVPVRNIQELVAEMDRLRVTVRKIRASIKYQLGEVLTSVYEKPYLNFLPMPIRIIKLFVQHRRKLRENKNSSSNLIQTDNSNPNRTIHQYHSVAPLEIFRKKPNRDTRIACIVEDYMYQCLSFEAVCAQVPEQNRQKWSIDFEPDMVLLAPVWDRMDAKNVNTKIDIFSSGWIIDFIKESRENNIPVVFWFTDVALHIKHYCNLLALSDYVFVADEATQNELKLLFPDIKPIILSPAVQPALHNPLKRSMGSQSSKPFVIDGWRDLLEYRQQYEQMLSPFEDHELSIVESSCRYVRNKLNDSPLLRRKIKGCVSKLEMISVYKDHLASFLLVPSMSSSLTRKRKLLESIACGAMVVIQNDELVSMELGEEINEAVIGVNSRDDFFQDVRNTISNEDDRQKRLHKARRFIYQNHTYEHRVQTLLNTINMDDGWNECPLVSVITVSKRPQLLEECLKKYKQQTYKNREWIVVVNKENTELDKFKELVKLYSDVRMEIIHEENNIGVCLNLGIELAKGKLWFKMDDDDFYGPNYLTDMILAWKTSGADLIGKPPAYMYSKREDALYLRNSHTTSNTIASKTDTVCGATITGMKDSMDLNQFSQRLRACVDSHYLECAFGHGMRVHLTDIYNFIIYRSDKEDAHTWRPDESTINLNSSHVCEGVGENMVMF